MSDSLCVPQYNSDGEERVILFLKMAPGKSFSPELVTKIKGAIRKALSARHIPGLLLETKDIPVRETSARGEGHSGLTDGFSVCPSAVHHQWEEGGGGRQTDHRWS